MSDDVTPFRIDIPEADLEDLRHRLRRTRWPEAATVGIFPKEIFRPSRRWAERQFPDLRYWNEPARGGHFAAFEQPAAFVNEVRAALRPLR